MDSDEDQLLEAARKVFEAEAVLAKARQAHAAILARIKGSGIASSASQVSESPLAEVSFEIRSGTNLEKVYRSLCGQSDWVSHKQIADATGIKPDRVRASLWYLVKKKLAKNGGRDRWQSTQSKT